MGVSCIDWICEVSHKFFPSVHQDGMIGNIGGRIDVIEGDIENLFLHLLSIFLPLLLNFDHL